MTPKSPSIQEWRELYDKAIEFARMKCWDWMWDTDVFGVQNPTSGEIGYCCIMGGAGEHYALSVYLGTEGLEGYLKIRSGEFSNSPQDMLNLQKCLMASFEDRSLLQREDLQVINKLGLKFEGHDKWPLFRNYEPGYYPWFITAEEARYLTLCLEQAMEVSQRFENDPELLMAPEEGQYLVRAPVMGEAGLSWTDEWLKPPPLEKKEVAPQPIDLHRIEEINRKITERQGVWEIDYFYFPRPTMGEKEERPFFPLASFWVDHHSGFILHQHLARRGEWAADFPEQFLKFAHGKNRLPQEILVKNEETFKLLEPIASELGIKLNMVKRLRMLEEAKAGAFKYFKM